MFLEAFSYLIRKNLANSFKLCAMHVAQNKGSNISMTSATRLYSDRSYGNDQSQSL